jgi:hypothetical protein
VSPVRFERSVLRGDAAELMGRLGHSTPGATTADLMARLGHSTIGAAMLYQHAAQDRDAQIAAAMSRMAQT